MKYLTINIIMFFCSFTISQDKLNRHYVRIWHPSRDDIYLSENMKFVRKCSPFLTSKKYTGTYSINNNKINFVYYKNIRPKNELIEGVITDSTLVLYYLMYYNKENYINKKGKIMNCVDTTIFGRIDTIPVIFYISKSK